MKPKTLFRSILPGFAPILAYIAVEAVWGETAGLAAALALGLGEFAFILIRERRVAHFVHAIEARVLRAADAEAAVLGGSGVAGSTLGGFADLEAVPDPAGVGFGSAAGLGAARPGSAAQEGRGEFLPVVNEAGSIVGKAPRPLCHAGPRSPKLLHPVVRLWLADASGGFWLQKRAAKKLVQPGKWDCAVGGHLAFGETVEAALRREAAEEIGLTALGDAGARTAPGALDSLRPLARFVWETELERELVFVFIAALASGAAPAADRNEVDELRVWSLEELAADLAKAPYERSLTALAAFEAERIEGLLRIP